jgi:hypothetical protein
LYTVKNSKIQTFSHNTTTITHFSSHTNLIDYTYPKQMQEHDDHEPDEDDVDAADDAHAADDRDDDAEEDVPESPGRKNKKKRDSNALRKAPQAPKRFKSSYICFFMAKQPEIKEFLGDKATVTEISKRSAEMWYVV